MLSNRNSLKRAITAALLGSVLTLNMPAYAGSHFVALTGWELSGYEIPAGPDAGTTGVEIIDSEADAYEGRGALHLWSGGTKAKGHIPFAATNIEALEEGKTYRFGGLIKTSQTTYGRPAFTVGGTDVATSLAAGLTAEQWCEFYKDFVFSGGSKELKIQMWNTGDVYLDNLSLKEVIGTDFGEELLQNTDFEKDYARVYKAPVVIKDDHENIIVGANSEMEYSTDDGSTWQAYTEDDEPHFSGNISVLIRYSEDPDKESHILKLNFVENETVSGDFSVSLFEIEKNTFTVKGMLKGAKNENVNILLVKEGKSRRSTEDVILVSSFETDENGGFSFQAPIADMRGANKNDGWYTMYLKGKNTGICEFNKVYFASTESRTAAVELLKSGNTGGYFDESSEYYTIFNAMGFALADYKKQGVDKAKAVQLFEKQIADIGSTLNEDNAPSEFARAVFLSATGGKNAATLYEIMRKHGSDFQVKYSDSVTLEGVLDNAAVMSWVSAYLADRPAQTMEEADKLFDEAYAFYLINNSTYGKMPEVIEAQKGCLALAGADYTEYMSLAKSGNNKAVTVSKYIVTQCTKEPFSDVSKFLKAISDGVASTKNNSGSSGAGGGGSGGGSGGGGGGSSSVPISGTTASTAVKPAITAVDYFDDLGGFSWAKDAVNTLFEKGIISGRAARVFAPQDNVTRQEFVKMIVDLTGSYDETAECDFEDTDKNAWYYRYVASAVKKGLIFGVSDTEFGTDALITREQMAVIANRILAKQSDSPQEGFADDGEIGEYAREAVYNIKGLGIMSGYEDGTFGPKNPATRAEAAVICLNLLNKR